MDSLDRPNGPHIESIRTGDHRRLGLKTYARWSGYVCVACGVSLPNQRNATLCWSCRPKPGHPTRSLPADTTEAAIRSQARDEPRRRSRRHLHPILYLPLAAEGRDALKAEARGARWDVMTRQWVVPPSVSTHQFRCWPLSLTPWPRTAAPSQGDS
jgi:hypothetical protein